MADHDNDERAEASRVVGGLFWRWRSPLGAVLVLLAAGFGLRLALEQFSHQINRRPESLLLPERIEVRGIPAWVTSDLKWQALRNASLDMAMPLDDPDLERRLARAFDMHPWVEQVERVETSHPAAATVTIRCRVPVAMVRVEGGLLAIDAETTVLPSADFTPEAAAAYPVIDGITTSPRGPEGASWGDPLVTQAASLLVAIGPEWQELGLRECRPRSAERGGGTWWELLGDDEVRILFGSAPGLAAPGEPVAAEKISRLRAISERHDSVEVLDDIDLTKSS